MTGLVPGAGEERAVRMDEFGFRFHPLQPGDPVQVGPYRLRVRLGAGGMGQVFLAFTPAGRPIAVKILKPELTMEPDFHGRFAREVEIAQRVDGHHVAQLLDADPRGRPPWLAQAYVAGPSLQELVGPGRPLPARDVLLIAVGVARGLRSIHAAGVVHRDLKPSNVMLDEAGPQVIDFGVVKALEPSAGDPTHATRIGTPAYMSPEQAMGRAVGPASDVFSLGSVLYFLSTGETAFDAYNENAAMYRVVSGQPDLGRLPEPVRPVIELCLQKDPELRPPPGAVIELCLAALGGAAHGAYLRIAGAGPAIQARNEAVRRLQPKQPDPDPAPARTSGSTRSRAGILAAVAVLCAALIGGLVIWALNGLGHADNADGPQTTGSASRSGTADTSHTPTGATSFDPDSLDSATTDQTPLTAAALLPPDFSDANGKYSLTFGAVKSCSTPDMLSTMQSVLASNDCAHDMVGDYVGPGSSAAKSDVVVFVQVYLFADAATAQQASTTLIGFYNNGGAFGYGYWCPPSGIGASLCTGSRAGFFSAIHTQHRYVIEASGLYANGTSGFDAYQTAAVEAAINACGPPYYLQAFHSIAPSYY